MLRIASILPPLPRLKIVDVGAIEGVDDDSDPYFDLASAVPCDVVGFEPSMGEAERLTGLNRPGRTYLPFVIGDGAEHDFHECTLDYMSSLFEPNIELLEKFQNLVEFFRVLQTSRVQTKRLDDIPETAGTDFLKVDVQGGELLVFQGAVERLKHVLVVHTEVEFLPMYKNQPLFADIDVFLRGQGFAFHKLMPCGRTLKPLVVNADVNACLSQTMWADAVYVRDFMGFGALEPTALLKLAAIMHENYRSFDLAALALGHYDTKSGTGLQLAYAKALAADVTLPSRIGARP